MSHVAAPQEPCPFLGNDSCHYLSVIVDERGPILGIPEWRECFIARSCGARGPSYFGADQDRAWALWNARP